MMGRGRDSGAVTVFFALIAPSWIVIIGMLVIGGGRVRAYQRADNVAAEAARAAGQAIDSGSAISGGAKVIDPAKAAAAATAYLNAVGATGTVTVLPGGREVTVRTTVSYTNPTGLGFIGGETWLANGEATGTLLIG